MAGNYDIFSKNAAYWLTIHRKKQNPDSSYELSELLNTLVEREYKTIKSSTSNKAEADFYFYTVFSKEDCVLWGDAELNGVKIKSYLEGSENLIISNLHENGSVKNERNSLFSWDLRSRFFGKLINKPGVYFKIFFDKKASYTLHNRELSYEDYSIDLVSEGLKCNSIDIDLVNIWLGLKPNFCCARSMAPLFDNKYLNIALNQDDIKPWMYCHTDFPGWFTKFISLPARDKNKAIDL